MDINVLDPRETLDYLLEGNTLTPEHLDRFLQANPEEGQYLDYKDGIVTTQQERANGRKIVREYINGFANSDGGILIIGVGRSKPREIKPCTSPSSEPLDKWAENCVHEMVPFFSPQPRFQVVNHSRGLVLVISVARAPSLVYCGQRTYFLRINQTTLEAPEYLISDLVLGRRQHSLLDLHYIDMDEKKDDFRLLGRLADDVSVRDVSFTFAMENMSLLAASDIEVGMLSWSFTDQERNINRYLLSYVDIVNTNHSASWTSFRPIHDSSKNRTGDRMDLDTFQQRIIQLPHLYRYRFPLVNNGKANCAMYLLSKGAPPTWFQLEYTYGSGSDGSVVLTRKGSGRPKVSWEDKGFY